MDKCYNPSNNTDFMVEKNMMYEETFYDKLEHVCRSVFMILLCVLMFLFIIWFVWFMVFVVIPVENSRRVGTYRVVECPCCCTKVEQRTQKHTPATQREYHEFCNCAFAYCKNISSRRTASLFSRRRSSSSLPSV